MNRILIIDDNEAVLNHFLVFFAQDGRFEVETLQDSSRAFSVIDGGDFDLILLDMDMPTVTGRDILRYVREKHDLGVIVITGVEDVSLAVDAMKLGAYDYICKPVDKNRLLTSMERALEHSRLRGQVSRLRGEIAQEKLRHEAGFHGIVTRDPALLRILGRLEQIARSGNNVLIQGESGTGKELVAHAIHRASPRAAGPFIAVNMAEHAADLFASEFFGHERGAFTGAHRQKTGFFEEADGGTLFLDEIGDLEAVNQAKLLRVLQEGEFFHVGSTQRRGVDVRVIATTNRDLPAMIEAGGFRLDLYYRLNISSIHLPPLRERKGDVDLLAYFFLDRHCRRNDRRIEYIEDDVLEILERYDYPGNVRELENIIASAVVLEKKRALTRRSLPPAVTAGLNGSRLPAGAHGFKTLSELEREHIIRVLDHTSGNRTAAARILGCSRVGLHSKLKKHGLD